MTKIKVYACYTDKIYKNKPVIFFKTGGRAPGAPVLDPPLFILVESMCSGTMHTYSQLKVHKIYNITVWCIHSIHGDLKIWKSVTYPPSLQSGLFFNKIYFNLVCNWLQCIYGLNFISKKSWNMELPLTFSL